MDKFLVKLGASGPSDNKRPAATPPGTAAGKKAKTSATNVGVDTKSTTAAWAKVRSIPVPAADYQDQTLLFTTLKDGRELLIGDAVWALPAGASAKKPRQKSGQCRHLTTPSACSTWIMSSLPILCLRQLVFVAHLRRSKSDTFSFMNSAALSGLTHRPTCAS